MNPSNPTVPESVTLAVESLLQAIRPGASARIVKLTGDASNRTYYRATCAGQAYVVMKLADGFNSVAEEITKVSKAQTELPFIDIQRYLRDRNVRVPQLFGVDRERGVLLLEDFGDRVLLDIASATSDDAVVRKLYERALDELEKIAVIPKDNPRTSVAFFRKFDTELYNWEFLHFVEYGLDKRLRHPPTAHDRAKIVTALEAITAEYLTWDLVFCHRDYHSRNIMVQGTPPDAFGIGILDFQDALMAPLFYDLASLLRDSYIALPPALQDNLVESFRLRMRPYKLKHTDSRDAFRLAFDRMGLHRNLKAAGRFCYIDQVKGNPRYLADVPRTLSYVQSTLEMHPDLKALADVLLPYLPLVSEACQK